jgi:hypothetical protein
MPIHQYLARRRARPCGRRSALPHCGHLKVLSRETSVMPHHGLTGSFPHCGKSTFHTGLPRRAGECWKSAPLPPPYGAEIAGKFSTGLPLTPESAPPRPNKTRPKTVADQWPPRGAGTGVFAAHFCPCVAALQILRVASHGDTASTRVDSMPAPAVFRLWA